MRYFVIAPDGSKYGPADVNTLRGWVSQGRIAPNTLLEEEASRQRVEARFVAGLFGSEIPQAFPPPQAGGGRPEYARGSDAGNVDVVLSYLCSAMSIICCGLFIIGGFSYASRAISKGNRGGYAARVVAIIFLILYCVLSILTVMFFQTVKEYLTRSFGIEMP